MTLKEQLLAKIQQNKLDRAKHQEQVEGLDRGLIYLQGQLDLVEQMLAAEAAKAKADAEALASSAKTEVQKLEGEASAELTKVENEVKSALEPASDQTDSSSEAGPATQSD